MKRKLSTLLMLLALFCTQAVFAQTTVTGQVVDENAEPLIGASVQLKGTSTGMPTDINGNFKVDAKSGQTLVVSYIGYDTTSVRKIILSRLCCNGLNPFLRNSCLQPKITILFVRITAI